MSRLFQYRAWRHGVWLLLALLALGGCGRKEMPQPVVAPSDKPQLVDLQYEQAGNVLKLTFILRGNPAGVGYQIDRTRIDPYCQCPGFWRRYTEQAALPDLANRKHKRIINLKTDKVEYLFRMRAVDLNGNFGPWSRSIRARGVDLFHK